MNSTPSSSPHPQTPDNDQPEWSVAVATLSKRTLEARRDSLMVSVVKADASLALTQGQIGQSTMNYIRRSMSSHPDEHFHRIGALLVPGEPVSREAEAGIEELADEDLDFAAGLNARLDMFAEVAELRTLGLLVGRWSGFENFRKMPVNGVDRAVEFLPARFADTANKAHEDTQEKTVCPPSGRGIMAIPVWLSALDHRTREGGSVSQFVPKPQPEELKTVVPPHEWVRFDKARRRMLETKADLWDQRCTQQRWEAAFEMVKDTGPEVHQRLEPLTPVERLGVLDRVGTDLENTLQLHRYLDLADGIMIAREHTLTAQHDVNASLLESLNESALSL